jgi:hypothetical protein
MKRLAVGLLALTFTFSAFAAKNSKTVDFGRTVQVGSTKVPAGPVKVSWTGSGAEAQATLTVGGKKPITVPVKVVEKRNIYPSISTISVNGVEYLQEIDLSDLALVMKDVPTTAAQSGN